ncbi:hypothetical protein QVD17_09837 [Tagetes erecta]|uniref:Protein kinase domain-containing protein n=1 Tax=Tagetes erecta TaxID=13708 RepID=A0AAD8P5E2_TARER|nr:hypothetical protein QVD17_09837 [Tagetes erecta]
MLTFSLPFISLLLLFTTTVQPYTATDRFFFDCGTSSTTTVDGRRWDGDESSKFFHPNNIITASFTSTPNSVDPSVDQIPYSTARIFNTSSFTYTFPVSAGPKFLRLYFYPTTYAGLNPNDSYFSVSSNGYSLLTNFSAYLTASFLTQTRLDAGLSDHVLSFVKEYIIYVKDTQRLNVTFTPSPGSYAFINGIEIVSMPDNLYFNSHNLKYVGINSGPLVNNDVALENFYRLNVGGKQITGGEDTGMYRTWDQDDMYIYSGAIGLKPLYHEPITYTTDTPNYTAPEQVYQTQRSMGNQSETYNLTWRLPVDSGFFYTLRLHFCNIIPQYTKRGQVLFKLFINNQTADEEIDLFHLTQGSGYPIYMDYVVFHDPDGSKGKTDLWVALHPNPLSELYRDGFLNGLEAFKLSMNSNLSSPNPPELSLITPPPGRTPTVKSSNKPPYAAIIGGVGGALFLLTILVLIVMQQRRRRVKHNGATEDRSSYAPAYSESKSTKSTHSTLPSDRCRRFSLTEVKAATNEFNDDFVIGVGGFGKVYKGYIDNASTTVAIKRLNESSSQGFQEFHTEIGLLSKLRHVQLVSLIGYCEDEGEMILVYDYMAHGTLREHLYKTNKPPISWKRRLQICIGAAKGLHYLHTGAKRAIIHRDVKSTNILLDENWVAKVSDFGLSKLGPRDQAQNHVSTVVKGSIGYVDPEYYRTQQLTDKSDVYSFGVVLLEVLCARPVMILGLPKEQVSLAEWGKTCYRKGTLNKIVDPKLKSAIAPECLRQFGVVAVSCLKEIGSERPAMDEVVWGLEFALELQEAAEKTLGEPVTENQELPFLMQGETTTTTTTTDDDVFTGSSAIRNGTSSISSSDEGFKSETVFSEILKPSGR